MAQKIEDYRPKSLSAYVDIVDKLQKEAAGPLWYRGTSRLSASLLPSLYRPRENPDVFDTSLSDLEAQLVARFRDRSLPYHSRPLQDDVETLFFMQHYGVPTRLLDWTENPLVGLFFALRGARYAKDSGGSLKSIRDVAVWVLDPTRWNQAVLARISYKGGPLDPGNDALAPYKSIGDLGALGRQPIAIYGAHNSQRIVAQQGTFVIFGAITTPMEKLYRRGAPFPPSSMARIILSPSAIVRLRKSLFSHGVTEGALFPDLEGLGRDLRRVFGFQL